ncbi:hypothetical protein QYE76_058946 [Lolium multiflorum]|uniref:Transposase (putative) gypsy type domain-containing protein n=1 Tax=Lolium multiflorum TaxID=4521 RepID=A0AAD8T6H2_LOLMU|nr:hypothetical protein QYE76_058946 [Lolium multiflorum]
MGQRSKQCKNRAPNTEEHVEKAQVSGWERSKLSAQDKKMLKKMGLLKKDAVQMPGDESSPHPPIGFRVTFVDFLIRGLSIPVHEFLSGLLFIHGIQLHQLTPNSLHISIFITLCDCFLGIHPHWGLWKLIFYLRRNNLRNVTYNVGGICICVRPEAGYFDVKFADSVQGWRRKWLYIKDESTAAQETQMEHAEDSDKVSVELPLKDLEKLVRRFTSLSKNDNVPSSCRVESFSGTHDFPEKHQILSCLPPLHEGGEVDGRAIVGDDSQEFSALESEPAESQKTAGSADKDLDSEQPSESSQSVSLPPAASPEKCKRKRDDDEEDSGASKPAGTTAEESSPEDDEAFDPYAMTGAVSSADEEEVEPEAHGPANTSTSNTLVLSGDLRAERETSPPPQADPKALTLVPSPQEPKKKKAKIRDEALHRAEERANDLEFQLKASEEAWKKGEKDASCVEDLRQRLQAAEDALSDREAKQVERENAIIQRLETQSRRFSRGKMGEHYTLSQESDDRLLDALDILELNCDLARKCLTSARDALKRIFPHFFPRETQPEIFSQLTHHFLAEEDPTLAYRQASLKIGVEGTVALVVATGQEVDWVKAAAPQDLNAKKWKAFVKGDKVYSKKLISFLYPKSSASASTAKTEVK